MVVDSQWGNGERRVSTDDRNQEVYRVGGHEDEGRHSQLSNTVGTYSLGNLFVVYEIRRQVLVGRRKMPTTQNRQEGNEMKRNREEEARSVWSVSKGQKGTWACQCR